jgi:zinc transporter ZupT
MASDGHAVEFDYTSSSDAEDEDSSNNWGTAIAACALVWFATFAMIVLYHAFSHLSFCKESFLKLDSMQMFASGTLMSSAFALIVFESSRSLTEETGVASMWMFVLVLGFLTSSILDTFAHALIDNNIEVKEFATVPRETIDDEMNRVPDNNGDVELKKVPSTTAVVALNADMEAGNDIAPGCECEGCELKVDPKLKQCRTYLEVMQDTSARKTALTIFIGDFVCNYCDGLVIASAFSACTTVLGWSIATVTILHELPQELADYAILVEQLKLNASTAALNNLICGFGVLLGAFTIMGTEVGHEFQAYFLAFGAGNFIYLAAVEFFSLARAKDASVRDKIEKIFFFLLGVTIIAIIARNHAHCEADHADETADAHADH